MSKNIVSRILFVLSCLGVLLTLGLVAESLLPKLTLPCPVVTNGCEGALASGYSHLGPVPTAAFGLVMYILLALLAFRRFRLSSDGEESATARQAERLMWLVALLGFGISWSLQWISIHQLQAFCPYCCASAVDVTLIFAAASRWYILKGMPLLGWQMSAIRLTSVLFLAFVAGLYWPAIQGFGPILPPPHASMRVIVAPDDMHVMGPRRATAEIVLFGDYQCPGCKDADAGIEKAIRQGAPLQLAFRNCPLEKHPMAFKAALAAEAAAFQGKFWPMHDLIYAHQDEMENPGFKETRFDAWARTLGLDVDRFKRDRQSAAVATRVRADLGSAMALRINTTPTIFKVKGASITRLRGLPDFAREFGVDLASMVQADSGEGKGVASQPGANSSPAGPTAGPPAPAGSRAPSRS